MTTLIPLRQLSLIQQVVKVLSEQIHKRNYSPVSQLPPENELFEPLKVNRATLCSALALMEARGATKRRQGVFVYLSENAILVRTQRWRDQFADDYHTAKRANRPFFEQIKDEFQP